MFITIDEAAQLIKKGHVVAVPTETVYGLAALADNIDAVESIYELKQRPPQKPLSIAISSIEMLHRFKPILPDSFHVLAKAFWPGPLTLVVPVDPATVPNIVRANLPNIGFRMPDQALTLELISKTGPLVLPSANFSGQPEATNPQQVEAYFGEQFPVINGGPSTHAIASTVIAYDNGWRLIRQGALPIEEIERVISLQFPNQKQFLL